VPKFTNVDENIRNKLEKIVGLNNISVTNDDLDKHAIDESTLQPHRPEVLVRPISTVEVSAILRLCNQFLVPVTTQGSRTGLSGASHPVLGGVALSTERMNQIIEIDEENFTCTVEPAVLVSELHAAVEKIGLYYPPDPGQESGSIGGNISTNAGGMRAIKYGVTRDYVQALEVVLSSGEVITMGGKNVKDSTGYSLIDLIIGSEGTLGVVTKATLRLLQKPKYTALIYAPFNSTNDAIKAVTEIIRKKIQPFALEYLPRHSILTIERYIDRKLPDNTHEAYLIIGLESNSESELESQLEETGETCIELGAIDAFIADKDEQQRQIWEARKAVYDAYRTFYDLDEVDVCVPRSMISTFVMEAEKISQRHGLTIATVGHAGDGNVHCNILRGAQSEKEWSEVLEETISELIDTGLKVGGTVSGEHGLGYTKRKYLERKVGHLQVKLMKDIKHIFDPNGILNPDKLWL